MLSAATVDAAHITFDFHPPDDDVLKDLIVPQIYDWNARVNPDYPLFVFHDGERRQYITYSTANKAIDRAARYALSVTGSCPGILGKSPVTIGILAHADTITYFCTLLGALRAGLGVFLISVRNTASGVTDMLQRIRASHIFVSADTPMQEVAKEALSRLSESGIQVTHHAMPTFQDLYPTTVDPSSPFDVAVEMPVSYDMTATSIIMHSSGSMGHPKTVLWNHVHLKHWGQTGVKCDYNLTATVTGCHGTPMFHGLGAFMCSSSPVAGLIVATFKPTFPPIVPTPEAVWDGIVATGTDMPFSVPSFIEEWARDPEKVIVMKRMKGLMFGGSTLNEEVGNTLAAQGVSFHSAYGLTEVGGVNTFWRQNPGMDWPYWTVNKYVRCAFRPTGDGTYEVVVISPPELPLPGKTNTKEGEFDAYATSDLVVPHPTIPGLWKIVGRADEQIILSNGEKTNPVPLEKMINADPHVKHSVMFGRGKFQNGVLVEPSEEYTIDPTDPERLAAFRNMIWLTIEQVNAYAPQHSRIFKEMILVTHTCKPLQFNAKGLPRRGLIIEDYSDEIEALYKVVETTAESDIPLPATWDAEEALKYVRAVVENTLNHPIPDDEDILRNGGDSLQATWIRNTILSAIRHTNPSAARRIPMNLVFAFPTITSLANVVANAVTAATGNSISPTHTAQDLWKYVKRYTADLPPRQAVLVPRSPDQKDVVLITGTTGGFGCDALEHLLRDEAVGRVYAFNRAGSQAVERQRTQFRARGLDEGLLDTEKFVMVEAVLHEPGFRIDQCLLEEIRGSVTHIMLNAWKVDFNMSLASFEVDMQAVRNFVDLALGSPYTVPPAIVFVSSVGVFSHCNLAPPVPEVSLIDPASAFGIGYSESKWVTEHVLQTVSETTDVRTVVVRLGQVTGDKLGYWNEKEWFPSLVKTALHQHCLPQLEGLVSWFPAYEAAKAFTEMRHSPQPILHLVHPYPVSWSTLLTPIAKQLNVRLVSYEEWLTALEASVATGSAVELEAMAANPALRILPFFRSQKGTNTLGREALGFVALSMEKATRVSGTLATLPQLDAGRAVSWVEGWRKTKFL